MNITIRQLITLLLLTITLVVFLSLLPEQPRGIAQHQGMDKLISQPVK